jgi:glycosyltransferase involved in cell wall biosynthesis
MSPLEMNNPTQDSLIQLSVILPGYNEEKNINETTARTIEDLDSLDVTYEVIIVNDCSTDETGKMADHLASEHPAIRVIHNPVNFNIGISLLIGVSAARGEIVFFNLMDLPFDNLYLKKIFPLFPENDVVVVVRQDRSAHSPWHKITSYINNWIIRILFRINIQDMNFVQAYKRSVLKNLPVRARSPAFITPELIIRARDSGYQIAQIEAPFHRRKHGKSNHGKPRDILWALADIISFRIESFTGKR